MVEATLPPSRILADIARPKTPEDWKRQIGRLLNVKQVHTRKSDKRTWNPGSKLVAVEGEMAVIQPPHHGKLDRVPLADIKLSKKLNHQRDEIEASRQEQQAPEGEQPPAPPAAEPEPNTDHWIVAQNIVTGLYFGPKDGKHGFYLPLKHATQWESSRNAWSTISYHKKRNNLDSRGTKYLTYADARAHEERKAAEIAAAMDAAAEAKAAEPAPAPDPEPVAAAPEPIPEPAPAPSPVAQAAPTPPPPAAPTFAEIALAARKKNVWEAWRTALVDEAIARGLHLEAQAKLAVAEANLRAEQQRQDWGIP